MKRREVLGSVRFITFSCEHRLPLFMNPAIRGVFEASLHTGHLRFRFELFAWVVMPEHVHLLMRPPESLTLDRVLSFIKTSVMRRVLSRWKELEAPILTRLARPDGTHRFWQKGGGFDRNVRDENACAKHVRYIHRNPVARGLVERPEDWKSSSIRWWMGQREGEVPCVPPPGDPRSWALWRGYV